MGLPKESPQMYGLRHSATPIPEVFEIRKTVQFIRKTVQNVFRNGAFITSDGKTIYYGVNEMTVPERLLEDFKLGRITECNPREIILDPTTLASRLKMFIVPPESNKKLVCGYGRNGGLDLWLLHGINDDGNTPLVDNLFTHSGPIQAFTALASLRLSLNGISQKTHSPKRIVNEALKELAENEGLGEKNAAIKRMRTEMHEAVGEAEKIITTNNH